jgi:hypothetical protein
MGEVNLIEAVKTLRSYNIALDGLSHDPQSLSSWITRYADNMNAAPYFCQDAAIGLLCHLGNPIYAYANLEPIQQQWSAIFGSAVQALVQEENWQNTQNSQNSQTSYARLFGTDKQWIQLYAQSLNYPLDIPFEYFVNKIITELRTCQGSNGAGGISHSPMTPPSMQQPMP